MTKKPLCIGLSACFLYPDPNRPYFWPKTLLYMEQSMAHWVMEHGALPLLIPTDHEAFPIDALIQSIDGLLLQGGSDVAPQSYGEEPIQPQWKGDLPRDEYEIELIHACIQANKPILAACRGHQILNVALGGTLFQDIQTQHPDGNQHRNHDLYDNHLHQITFTPDSLFAEMHPDLTEATVNSVHHQAIKDLAQDLEVGATSSHDHLIEAVYLRDSQIDDPTKPYVTSVQWHPEFHTPERTNLLDRRPLMQGFLDAAEVRRTQP